MILKTFVIFISTVLNVLLLYSLLNTPTYLPTRHDFYVEADVREEVLDTIIVSYGTLELGYFQDTLVYSIQSDTWLKNDDSIGLLEK